MKLIYFFLIILIVSSCKKKDDSIIINLEQNSDKFNYTQISKKVDYIKLDIKDDCLLTDIKKILFDNDTLIIQDTKHEGIFIFTRNGNFVKQINYIGQGPSEYHNDDAIAIDSTLNQIYIYDMMNFKINKYTYNGKFIASQKIDFFIRDFAMINNNFLMIQPCINKVYKRNGLWVYYQDKKTTKQLLEYDDEDQNFEFMSTYITQTSNKVYYYDRNDDNIYAITNDSLIKVCGINLEQKIPKEIRKHSAPSNRDLEQKSMMYDFCISSRYIILNYFTFGENKNPFKWVLIDTKNNNKYIFNSLIDNIDNKHSSNNKIFYVNDSTWCRLIDQKENDDSILLQLIHLNV